MQDSATAGFKYFDCKNITEVSIKARGYADGVFEIKNTYNGKALTYLKVRNSNVWEEYTAPLNIPDGIQAIYITYRGNGSPSLKSFTLR